MKPFFISPPRTRSSILYSLLEPYVIDNTNLLPIVGHTEPFLHVVQNKTVIDAYTQKHHLTEMFPVMNKNCMNIHYVYPWIYKDNRTSVIEKLKLLQKAKDEGREYYIKGTYNIAEALDETLEFFSDYDVILTLRKDIIELVASTLFAVHTKMFHPSSDTLEIYQSKIDEGMKIDQNTLKDIDGFLEKVCKIYKLKNKINATVVYYEDLNSQEKIEKFLTSFIGSDKWKNYNHRYLPTKIEKDYSKIISNYDEMVEVICTNPNFLSLDHQ